VVTADQQRPRSIPLATDSRRRGAHVAPLRREAFAIVTELLRILHYLGGGVCHQLPGRSFLYAGQPLPVCARCSGTFLGALVAMLLIAISGRARACRWPQPIILALLSLFLLLWAGDGLNSYLTLFPAAPHLYEPSNTLRVITGAFQGLALVILLWPFMAGTFWRTPDDRPVLSPSGLAVALAALAAIVALVLWGQPGILLATALLSAAGQLALFALLNALLLVVARQREATLSHGRELAAYLAAGLIAGLVELTILSAIRHLILPW